MSGTGPAQRIALCRALLHDPPIILADEPTGNLDPASADVVAAELRRRADAGACVLVALAITAELVVIIASVAPVWYSATQDPMAELRVP